MAYVSALTVRGSVFLGVTGFACLGMGYALALALERINRIGRGKIKTITHTQNDEATSFASRVTSSLSIRLKRAAETISFVTMLSLSCLPIVLWFGGALCVSIAVVGPLLY